MATWTDYNNERDVKLTLAELTSVRIPEKEKEPEFDAERHVDLEADS